MHEICMRFEMRSAKNVQQCDGWTDTEPSHSSATGRQTKPVHVTQILTIARERDGRELQSRLEYLFGEFDDDIDGVDPRQMTEGLAQEHARRDYHHTTFGGEYE